MLGTQTYRISWVVLEDYCPGSSAWLGAFHGKELRKGLPFAGNPLGPVSSRTRGSWLLGLREKGVTKKSLHTVQ